MRDEMPAGVTTLGEHQVALDSVFTVASLFIVGTREADGSYNLAPKHMAGPLGWAERFGFICTPQQTTYDNVCREGAFTVSYPAPTQIVLTSLAASPRIGQEGSKRVLESIPTFPAACIDAPLVRDAYLFLECELERVVEGLGDNTLVVGRIVAAHARDDALRSSDADDQDLIYHRPLLAYVSPGRYATIDATNAFPFPEGMRR